MTGPNRLPLGPIAEMVLRSLSIDELIFNEARIRTYCDDPSYALEIINTELKRRANE